MYIYTYIHIYFDERSIPVPEMISQLHNADTEIEIDTYMHTYVYVPVYGCTYIHTSS